MAGRGREVADAYIDVHGDLSKFRKSMDKAKPQVRKVGDGYADAFSEAFGRRAEVRMDKIWNDIFDASAMGKAIDWDNVFGNFDTKNLDEAFKKTKKFLQDQMEAGNLTEQQFEDLADQAKKASKIIQNENEALAKHNEEVRKGIIARRDAMAKHQIQLKSAADAWKDMEKFAKEANDEIARIENDELREHNNLIKEGSLLRKKAAAAESALRAKQRKAQREAIEELKEFNKTYEGMLILAEDDRIDKGMRRLANFMAGADLGPNRESKESVENWKREMTFAINKAKELGRVSDEEFSRVTDSIKKVIPNVTELGNNIDKGRKRTNIFAKATSLLGQAWKNMDDDVRLIIGLIVAGAGPMSAALSGIAASFTAVASSAALAVASIVPLAAAFSGLGVGVALAVSGFDDMVKRFPGIKTEMEGIGNVWEAQASRFGTAWGPAFESFLSSFKKQLGSVDFGTALGKSFATITKAFEDVVNGAGFSAFMKAMGTDIPDAVAGLGTGFAGVTDALMNLLAGAAPVAKLLGEDFAKWGTELGKAAEKARESGKMNEVFEKARESLHSVLDLVGSLGKTLGAVFMAGADSGNRLLDSLTGMVDKFTEWTQTVEGEKSLEEWFKNGERIIKSFGPLLAGVGGFFDNLVTDHSISQFEDLAKTVGDFLPTLGSLLSVVSNLGVFNALAAALDAVSGFLEPLLPSLESLSKVIGTSVVGAINELKPLFESLGNAVAPIIENFAKVAEQVFPKVVSAIGEIVPVITPVIDAIGKVVGVVADFLIPIFGSILIGVIDNVVGAVKGIAEVFAGFGTVIDGFMQIFSGDLAGGLATIWEGIKQIFVGAVQAIWNLVQLWFVGKLVAVVRGAMSSLLGIITKNWGSILGFFKGIGSKIIAAFLELWTGVQATTITVIGAIATFLTAAWTGISTGISTAWNAVMTFFSTLWTSIQTIFTTVVTAISTFLTTAWTAISTTVTTVWTAITSAISTAWAAIQALVSAGLAILQGIWSSVWNAISSTLQAVWDGIVSIVQWGLDVANAIITGVLNGIRAFFQGVWDSIYSNFKTQIDTIVASTKAGFKMAQQIIMTVWNAIRSFLSGVMAAISGVLKNAWNTIRSVITGVVNGIRNVISTVWNAIRNVISGVMNGIRNTISTVWNAIRAVVNNVMNGIRNTISNIWNSIRSVVSGVVNGIRNAVSNGFNAIRSVVSGVMSGIRGALSNAWNAARSIVSGAISAIRSTVSNGFNNVLNYVRGLPGRISGALGSLGGLLRGAGRAIMDGLLGGLKAAWGGVQDFVGGVADWISRHKGPISYDRKLLIPAGNAIMQGLGKGLEDMLPDLKGKLDVITGTMADSLSSKKLRDAAGDLASTAASAMNTSQLYLAGRNAADQLADGLKDGRRSIEDAMSGLATNAMIPESRLVGSIHARTRSAVEERERSAQTNQFNEGAIQVVTPAQDGRVVASQLLDEFTRHVGG